MLAGNPTVYANRQRVTLSAGDYVIFEGGVEEAHYLSNETNQTIELLTVSTCPPGDAINYDRHEELVEA